MGLAAVSKNFGRLRGSWWESVSIKIVLILKKSPKSPSQSLWFWSSSDFGVSFAELHPRSWPVPVIGLTTTTISIAPQRWSIKLISPKRWPTMPNRAPPDSVSVLKITARFPGLSHPTVSHNPTLPFRGTCPAIMPPLRSVGHQASRSPAQPS